MSDRSCCVCRKVCAKDNLVRLARKADENGIYLDCAQKFSGRGVYVHADASCWNSKNLLSAMVRCFGANRRQEIKRAEDTAQVVFDRMRALSDVREHLHLWGHSNLTLRKQNILLTLNKLLTVIEQKSDTTGNTKVRVRL